MTNLCQMRTSRKRRNKRKRRPLNPKSTIQSRNWRFIEPIRKTPKLAWKIVVFISVIFGIYATWVQVFSSRLSVSVENALDPKNIFSTPFIISNDGYVSLYDVQIELGVGEMNSKNDRSLNKEPTFNSKLRFPNSTAKELMPTEKLTYKVPINSKSIKIADVAISISYRPEWGIWRKEDRFRFQTSRASDGQLYWMPNPLSK